MTAEAVSKTGMKMFLNATATHEALPEGDGYEIHIKNNPLTSHLELPPGMPLVYSNVIGGCVQGCLKSAGWEG
eukprot:CAMPEP_0182454584 /NCGR_PEP_ID=MMETSP1319-20130603/1158_1 /TAXON_ID=172717 /ORGANISM="Bolidomonas pacifica, Strain RCC208" /LENGTH=72 /DNA_ID=CAMNT_0024652603 /DNA_START=686 /DNA_END=901 /DNA_ORIENTATION=-